MYSNQAVGQAGVNAALAQSEAPSHIVKYRAVSHTPEKISAPMEERVFNNAEDAEAYATSLVVGCGAHPDSIRIYAETGARVAVNMQYSPTGAATAGPRPATGRV